MLSLSWRTTVTYDRRLEAGKVFLGEKSMLVPTTTRQYRNQEGDVVRDSSPLTRSLKPLESAL